MTPVQGEPPKLDFRLPKKLKRFLASLRQFAIESQPVNGPGILLEQTPRGRILDSRPETITAVRSSGGTTAFNLKISDATSGSPTVAAVSVRWGEIAGFIADSGMVPGNSPLYILVFGASGVRIIYAKLTGALDASTSKWEPTDCEVLEGASLPTNTATNAFFKIGEAEREANPAGGTRVKADSIGQSVSNSQGFVRNYYSASLYLQHNWND